LIHSLSLFLLAPVLSNGWCLLGELDKFVSIAFQRIQEVWTGPRHPLENAICTEAVCHRCWYMIASCSLLSQAHTTKPSPSTPLALPEHCALVPVL
jgi:hypothetical protein